MDGLRQKLEKIIKPHHAKIGIAIMDLESRDTLTINNNHHYPMMSVCKFPLAMAVLHQVDQGKCSLDQKTPLVKADLDPRMWGPILDSFPKGSSDLTLADLLYYSTSHSDNIACKMLFKIINGPLEAEKYVRNLGIQQIAIPISIYGMAKDPKLQYSNWSEPYAMVQLLDLFYRGKSLSDSSTSFLTHLMIETPTGMMRIKGLLPPGTVVAHKTGTSGTDSTGLRTATNDIGIVTLPDGRHFAIAVFVSDSMLELEVTENIIAEIAKATYDHLISNENKPSKTR
jgi:beta-lactamase class A